MQVMRERTHGDAAAIAADVLGTEPRTIGVESLGTHAFNEVYLCRAGDKGEGVVVKLFGRASNWQRETDALRACGRASAPIAPRLLATGASRWAATEFVTGPVLESWEPGTIEEALVALWSLEDPLVADAGDMAADVEAKVMGCAADLERSGRSTPAVESAVRKVTERLAAGALGIGPVVRCHGDLKCENVLRTNGSLTLVDWEHSTQRSAVSDLAILSVRHPGAIDAPAAARLLAASFPSVSASEVRDAFELWRLLELIAIAALFDHGDEGVRAASAAAFSALARSST